MRSEERRALVLLGTAAIVASILGAMLSVVWSGAAKPEDFYFNLPPVGSPIRHATFYWIDILEFMLGAWLLYGFCAFWYFSADWLSPRTRKAFHYGATLFMGVYVLYISAYIPLVYLDVVYVTNDTAQAFIYLLIVVFIFILEFDFIRFAMGIGHIAWIPRILRRIFRRRRAPQAKQPEYSNRYIAE